MGIDHVLSDDSNELLDSNLNKHYSLLGQMDDNPTDEEDYTLDISADSTLL